jgi:ribonucleotide reductase alpha subunit
MVKYEAVAHETTEEYFRGNQFSIDAFNSKYAGFQKETYVQALKRVCDNIASMEDTEEKRKYWAERWFDEIYNDWWHPAGSIMQGAGSGKKISACNCTHISMGGNHPEEEWDSLEGINNAEKAVAKAAAFRQGLGVDFSRLRPRGMKVFKLFLTKALVLFTG